MGYIVVDVEADGPIPGENSMIAFAAVVVTPELDKTFTARLRPVTDKWVPGALSVCGITREESLEFPEPNGVMHEFFKWVEKVKGHNATFISDNPAFDWQFINYYFHKYVGKNPFGFSGRRIGDLYCGMKMHAGKNHEWKKNLRKTAHTHDPLDDAKGNAEALLAMQKMGLNIKFE
jgi:DNA polymerase III epsilon subunit-like protein